MSIAKRTTRTLSLIAALAACSSAQAAFVFVDTAAPVGSAPITVPTINNFRSNLTAVGVSSYSLGRMLGVTGVDPRDQVNIDFFASEAGYRNQFRFGSSTVVDNTGNQSWSERDRGNFNLAGNYSSNGVLNFSFCAVTVSLCISNSQNDTTRLSSAASIGMWISSDGNTAWLLWDDSGGGADDNHDDLIVRLTYRSVPEPGTLALLGLGLVGIALARRRRRIGVRA